MAKQKKDPIVEILDREGIEGVELAAEDNSRTKKVGKFLERVGREYEQACGPDDWEEPEHRSTKGGGVGGRPGFEATLEQYRWVKRMAQCGMTNDMMAVMLRVSKSTLKKYFGDIIVRHRGVAGMAVAKSTWENAVIHNNFSAQKFWLGAQNGWTERESIHSAEAGASDAVFAPRQLSRAEFEVKMKVITDERVAAQKEKDEAGAEEKESA